MSEGIFFYLFTVTFLLILILHSNKRIKIIINELNVYDYNNISILYLMDLLLISKCLTQVNFYLFIYNNTWLFMRYKIFQSL